MDLMTSPQLGHNDVDGCEFGFIFGRLVLELVY
jgi:L-arabinose isomerase